MTGILATVILKGCEGCGMEKFVITGTEEGLHGRVKISGAKNAVLPILAACLLTEEALRMCGTWQSCSRSWARG